MYKTIKTIALIVTVLFSILTSSCLTGEEKIERTLAMEMADLNTVVKNLEADGYDIDTTELGIYYIIHETGTGPFPQAGDTCFVEYTGYFLDGTIFDASQDYIENGIWEFIYLEQELIQGFDNGISLMNKGTKIDMIIPSYLAYGPFGYGIIKPYTTIVFSAKMHDLKPIAD